MPPDCGNGITITEHGSRNRGSPAALVIWAEVLILMLLLGLMVHLVWSLVWGCVLKPDGSSCKVKKNVSFKTGSGSVGSHRIEPGLAAHSQTISHRNSWAVEVPGTK